MRYRLLVNLKKCSSFTKNLIFQGYIVSVEGIKLNLAKVEATQIWSAPRMISENHGFYELISFYRHFMTNFSNQITPSLIAKKGESFNDPWG